MLTPRLAVAIFSMALMVVGGGMAGGQEYPNKPIRIVTSAVGGGTDFVARVIAQGISGPLGQPVIVENRGSGIVTGAIVSKAPADGYTLFVAGPTFWLAPFLFEGLPWHPVRDFSPITLAASSPNIVVVHPSVAANSVKELIALAKAKPGALNYGMGGAGSTPHLGVELFKAMAGVNIVQIAYKGQGPALNDLLGGQIQLMFAVAASVVPHVKSGRLRALAVTSAQPSALAPGLPTVAAAGLPGFDSVQTTAAFVPAKTPAAIVNRVNREMAQALNRADVKEKLFNAGTEAVGSSPAQLAAAIKSEMTAMGKVIRDGGIRGD